MIVVSRRKLPFPALAFNQEGETAYYIDHDSADGLFDIDEDKRVAYSRSGQWYPNVFDGRLSILIAGNPGAGKSYLATQLINMFPDDYEVLLFTALEEEDGNFSHLKNKLYKIRMEPENLQRLSLTEIRKNCKCPILLFDDIDKIRDKRVEKQTFALLEDALANGRGHKHHDGVGDIHTIVTSHALNDYRKTKYTLENSDYVALFPGSTTYRQFETMCNKLGLTSEMCKGLYERGKRGVRSIIIRKIAPMYIIAGNELILI